MLNISVIGSGYLGLVHAVCLAELGHQVVAIDSDHRKVAALKEGRSPIFEPGLDELLRRALDSGRITFATDYRTVAACDVHFICVGTPQAADTHRADTSAVFAAVRALLPVARTGSLIVGKSTVPVGTAVALRDVIAEEGSRDDVRLAWNPEFLREGFAIHDTMHPDRLVYGVDGPCERWDVKLLDEVYASALAEGTPRLVTNLATAELTKVSANAFLATKISFINAVADVCDATGADVTVLADAIGYDKRIGRQFLNAGIGFGGGCLPKDIRGFMARAEEVGASAVVSLLKDVDEINLGRRVAVVHEAREACGGTLVGARVAVLGAAFKPNSDDIRDSPALDIAVRIMREGGSVMVHDPKAMPAAQHRHPELSFGATVEDACVEADVVLHLTEWADYREINPETLAKVVGRRCLIDGRNALDRDYWVEAGWDVRTLGRGRLTDKDAFADIDPNPYLSQARG
jgi:UDPglucose 6-dehydrogenase